MWETYELGNEDLLWSCIAFNGGIGGQQQAPCGAVSAAAVCLGLRHSCPLTEKQQATWKELTGKPIEIDTSQMMFGGRGFGQRGARGQRGGRRGGGAGGGGQ